MDDSAKWAMVPVEPTGGQLQAGLTSLSDSGVDDARVGDARRCYAAMLAAAPPPPAGSDGQDRKFAFRDGQFVNRVSGELIPLDEPVIIFRARDRHALDVLGFYQALASDPHHVRAIQDRINEFQAFKDEHAEAMKEPGITRHIRLNELPTPPVAPRG